MRRAGVGRNHHSPADVVLEMGRPRWRIRRARPNDCPAVTHSRRQPQHDGDLPSFRNLHRLERKVVNLLRIRRFQHRHAGRHGVMPVVLLVLAGSQAGIVGGHHDQRTGHARVGRGKQRVGGNVQADVFHRGDGPRPRERHAQRNFESDLFVRRPLRVSADLREMFEDFRGRRARITRAQRHAGVQSRHRHRLIAAQ